MEVENTKIGYEVNRIRDILQRETFESGILQASDYEFAKLLKEYDTTSKSVMLFYIVSVRYLNSTDTMKTSILRMISRINKEELFPLYANIAIWGLKEKNDEIFEAAVSCFEQWNYGVIELKLANLNDRPYWLWDYTRKVIIDIS